MTLRVAIVGACPYPVPQGSQVFLRDTALALHNRGHDVHLIVYGYGEGVDESGLRIHRSAHIAGGYHTKAGPTVAKPLLDFALVVKLRQVVRAERIDVTLAHNYEGLLVALVAGARPVVYQAHNAMADELPHYAGFGVAGQSIGRWLDTRFPRRAEQVVVPHPALAHYLVACGCGPGKVSVIAPPASTEWFRSRVADSDSPPIVYAGNLDAYQNVLFLKHVMERVRAERRDARLVLATRDCATFKGAEVIHTPDFETLREILQQDCVVVCPRVSWSGYPIKLLNAMAAGRPIVACRSAAHPIEHEGTGIIVDDNDEEAFANAVLQLMHDPQLRNELGSAARHAVDAHHSASQFAESLESVFERALVHKR